jgi:23S rRNA pseudouridine1911/1915/1917 synthase
VNPPSNISRFTVHPESSGFRLDVFLARSLPSFSRAKIQKLIEDGRVLRNGENAAKKTPVSTGDTVEIDASSVVREAGSAPPPQDIPLDILYEDEFLCAVNKPAGMVVHPGSGVAGGTLVNALLHHVKSLSAGWGAGRPGIVHRLDKDTSGVLIVAKTDETHAALGRMFAAREIHKEYIGMCAGRRPQASGNISAPLGRSRRDPVRRSVRGDGKDALTEYVLLSHHCGISVVRFLPRTGRTHQIRVHASVSGFPVVADSVYGGGRDAAARVAPLCRPFAAGIYKCFTRHALHARRISFVHPGKNVPVSITAPFPEDFKKALGLFTEVGQPAGEA